ncbi:MAG: lipid II:glycine glycyltransferase FemX [Sphaerimonospora mesophila]
MSYQFSELEVKAWDAFERAHPDGQFLQGIQRIAKRRQMGYQSYIIGVKQNGKIIGGGVLLGRDGEFWMPYGPLLDWKNTELVRYFLDQVIDFSRGKGFIKIEIFPRTLLSIRDNKGTMLDSWDRSDLKQQFGAAGFTYQGETINYQMKAGRWAFVKDLTGIKTVDQLRASYRKTLRARLRQTEGQIEIGRLKRDELPLLIGLIDDSDNRNGVTGRELAYYQMMYDAFDDDAQFMIARKSDDHTPIAGAIFIHHGHEISSYLSGMDRRYRHLNGRAWLQDYMMTKYLGTTVTRVNFFWIEGKFHDNHLLEFKSGFGGVVEEYIGGFEKVLRPSVYTGRKIIGKGKRFAKKLLSVPSRLRHRN